MQSYNPSVTFADSSLYTKEPENSKRTEASLPSFLELIFLSLSQLR